MAKKPSTQKEISEKVAAMAQEDPGPIAMAAPDPLVNEMTELSVRVARSTIAVIDTITARGGFRGEELSTIGQLRDQCAKLQQVGENVAGQIAQANG